MTNETETDVSHGFFLKCLEFIRNVQELKCVSVLIPVVFLHIFKFIYSRFKFSNLSADFSDHN